jgi:hypothetical protein
MKAREIEKLFTLISTLIDDPIQALRKPPTKPHCKPQCPTSNAPNQTKQSAELN